MKLDKIKDFVRKKFAQTINSLFGNRNYKKFVIISKSRSGSNLLISFLNSHPKVEAHAEIYGRLKGRDPQRIWDEIFSKKIKNLEQVGFKIFYYHPIDSDDKTAWNLIKNDKTIKIIHLKRLNKLRNYTSRLIANQSNIWRSDHGNKAIPLEERKIELKAEACIKEFEQIEKWENEVVKDFSDHPFLEITFEDLVKQPQEIMDKVFSFLELQGKKVKSHLKRQNPEKLEDLISNYEEIHNALKKTRFFTLLEK